MSKARNKKIRYIHIGFPKCASTTLQLDFFGKHPQLLHLGVGYNKDSVYWEKHIDRDVTNALEMELRYKKDLVYDAERVKKVFQKYFDIADKDSNVSAVGISSEHLSYTFTTDIDVTQKAERLLDIFGPDTKIIIFIREQNDFIKSMYAEYIRCGYIHTFDVYLEYTYALQDLNFLSDLLYYNIYKLYSDLFGAHNIYITPFERLKDDPKNIQKELCNFLGIGFTDLPFDQENKALPIKALEFTRQINNRRRHFLGNPIWDGSFNHRLTSYFTKCLKITPPANAVADFEIRTDKLREAQIYASDPDGYKRHLFKKRLKKVFSSMALECIRKIPENISAHVTRKPNRDSSVQSLLIPEKYRSRFFEMFAGNNVKLSESAGIDLRKYNYPMAV
jgi:hypothetical protein